MRCQRGGVDSGRRAVRGAFLALAAYYLIATFVSAAGKAAVMDEVVHLSAGISYWKFGDFRINPEHPPLIKLAAAGVAMLATRVECVVAWPEREQILSCWEDANQFGFGNYIIYHENDADRLLAWGRVVPILIGLLGGWVAWWWGRQLGGTRAGVIAAGYLLLYPEYMGHARWVTFDVPTLAACGVLSAALWHWWKRPTPGRAAVFIVVAIAGVLVKLTVAVFLALLGITVFLAGGRWFARRVSEARPSHRPFHRRRGRLPLAALFALTALVLWGVLWVVYGFRFSVVNPGQIEISRPVMHLNYAPESEPQTGIFRLTYPLRQYRLVPEAFLAVLNHTGSFAGRLTFRMGETSRTGFYDYFFWSTLLKTPLLYLVLGIVLLAGWLAGRRLPSLHPGAARSPRGVRNRIAFAFWFVPFFLLLIVTILARMNLGHRYVLFFYLPWCVGIGCLLSSWLKSPHVWMRRLGWVCIAAPLLVNLWSYPHYATYFNLLGGPPQTRIRYLSDSNVDWGQDLKAAGRLLARYGDVPVNLAYFGMADPEYYGILSYRQILPSYPFTANLSDFAFPDRRMPTLVSLNNLFVVKMLYPLLTDEEPVAVVNSMVLYPAAARSPVSKELLARQPGATP